MLSREPIREPLLSNEKDDEGRRDGDYYDEQPLTTSVSYNRLRYWIVNITIHSSIFVATMLFSTLWFHSGQLDLSERPESRSFPMPHNWPLSTGIRYKHESLPADAWSNGIYTGEPRVELEVAWDISMTPRGFRLHQDEAKSLNFTDSVLLQPGNDYSSILGVIHNLHCLRRMRQSLFMNHYYPNATEEEMEHDRTHNLHCIEAIRSSLLCYPDLNPHPYFWSGRLWHDAAVSAQVTRQCVDWEALQKSLVPRSFDGSDMIRDKNRVD